MYIMRFLVHKVPKFADCLKLDEGKTLLSIARLIWLKAQQENHYHDVIEAIKGNKPHPLTKKFNLFIDNDQLIRCRARSEHATLSLMECFPILLPPTKFSRFTALIILFAHKNNFHAGTAHTLAAVC